MVGMDDEDHLRAACWNLLWALNQRKTHPELDDRFFSKLKSENSEDSGIAREPLIPVVCGRCGAHFGLPTSVWSRDRYKDDGDKSYAITICPHCHRAAIVAKVVEPDE